MFRIRNRIQSASGIILVIFGFVAVCLAILISPTFASNHFSSDHSLSLISINQLNQDRFIASFCGLLLIISGSILMIVKDLDTTLRQLMEFFQFGITENRAGQRTGRIVVAIFTVLVGVTAFVLMIWITPFGAGVNPDSTTYIAAAKSILAGKGFSVNDIPLTHYPPLYPLFLAATGFLENNIVQAARFLNAFLFGINVGLITLSVYLSAGRNFLTTTCAALFFLLSAPLIELHALASSEPLFISLSLSCILLLCLHVMKPSLPLLIASSLLLGFALITRYVGVAFIPAALVIVFISRKEHRFGRRVCDALVFLALSCTPLAILFVRNLRVAGSATNRSVAFHPLPIGHYLTNLLGVGFNFAAPVSLPASITTVELVLIAAIVFVPIIIYFKRRRREMNWRSIGFTMSICCLLFSFSYVLFLYISVSSVDAATSIDARILTPILTIMIVGVFSAIGAASQTLKNPVLWACFVLIVAMSISIKTPDAFQFAATIQENGLEYTSRQWKNLESVAFVKMLPDDVIIYSNGADVLGFLADKNSLYIPRKANATSMESNSSYGAEVDAMCKEIKEKGALLVYISQINWRWYLPTQEELTSSCKLPVLRTFRDGTVYGDQSK